MEGAGGGGAEDAMSLFSAFRNESNEDLMSVEAASLSPSKNKQEFNGNASPWDVEDEALKAQNDSLKEEVLQLAREVSRLRGSGGPAGDEEADIDAQTFGEGALSATSSPRESSAGGVGVIGGVLGSRSPLSGSFFGEVLGGASSPSVPCAECSSLRVEVSQLAHELKTMKVEGAEDAQKLKSHHDKRFNAQKKENQELRQKLEQLTAALDEAKSERKALSVTLKRERAAMDKLAQESAAEAKAAMKRYEQRNADFKQQVKQIQSDSRKKLQSREKEMRQQSQEKDRQLQELRHTLKSATENIAESQRARDTARAELKEAHARANVAKEDKQTALKKLKLKSDSLDVAQAHVKELRTNIGKLKKDVLQAKKGAGGGGASEGALKSARSDAKEALSAKDVAQRTLSSALQKLKAATQRIAELEQAAAAASGSSQQARTALFDSLPQSGASSPSRARLLESRLSAAETELAEVQENNARVHRAMAANLEAMLEEERDAAADTIAAKMSEWTELRSRLESRIEELELQTGSRGDPSQLAARLQQLSADAARAVIGRLDDSDTANQSVGGTKLQSHPSGGVAVEQSKLMKMIQSYNQK